MKLKEVLLRELRRRGIRHLFGVPGRENGHILFNEVDSLDYITTRVEFTAGIMADIAGRISNRPQACFCTMGPGATNMTTGVASAMLNKSPVIFFSAQLESDDKFYNLTHQCVDQVKIMEPITKWSYELNHPQELPDVIEKAFRLMMTEPLGPVHIAIPADFFDMDITVNYDIEQPVCHKVILENDGFDLITAKNIHEEIIRAKQPLCLIGQEIIRVGAEQSVIEFCKNFNIPFITAANAKGIAAFDEPLNYGSASCYMEGILNYPALEDIFSPVDLLICLGYQYVDDLLPKMWKHGEEKRVVSITSSYGRKVYAKLMPDIESVCNISKLLREMIRLGTVRKNARNLKTMKDQYKRLSEFNPDTSDNMLSPIQVIHTVNQNLKEGILVTDIGYYRHHAIIFTQTKSSGHFYSDTGLSSFGSGLPSAAAAQLLNPGKRVFLICGDGGFHSGSGDLATLVKYNLPVIIILLNNSSFELIRLYQKRNKEGSNPDIVSLQQVDFVKLAEANGCSGIKVCSTKELENAIKTFDHKKPLLIEVPITYDGKFVISF